MPRSRDLRPEFFTDEKVGNLPYPARLLFAALWCHSDLRGVFEWSPRQIRVLVFPYDEDVTSSIVDGFLAAIEGQGMIRRFEAQGKTWGHILKWHKHQTASAREVEIGTNRPTPPGWVDPPEWRTILENGIRKGRVKQNRSQDYSGNCSQDCSQNNTPSPSPSPSPAPSPAPAPAPANSNTSPPPPVSVRAGTDAPQEDTAAATAAHVRTNDPKRIPGESSHDHTGNGANDGSGAGSGQEQANPRPRAAVPKRIPTGPNPDQVRNAVHAGDLHALIALWGAGSPIEWQRDHPGISLQQITVWLWWAAKSKKPIRHASGGRAVRDAWMALDGDERRQLAEIACERYGLPIPTAQTGGAA